MNKTWKKLFILPLLLAALVAPLRAQTDDSISNGPNPAAAATPPATPAPSDALDPHNPKNYPISPEDMVPIFGIVGVFGGGTVIVGLFLYFRYRRNKMLHETLRAMVDKGVPIPPELLGAPQQNTPPRIRSGVRNDFLIGLVLVAVGLGLSMLLEGPARKFGFIPLFIGVAFLISWKVEQKKKDQPGK